MDYTGQFVMTLLLFLNFLVAFIYLSASLLHCGKGEKALRRKHYLLFTCFILGPIVAPLSVLLGFAVSKFLYPHAENLAAVTFRKDRVLTLEQGDFEHEVNLIPVKEALSISDTQTMRRMMLNILRTGIVESAPQISLALASNDSETSHYAAAAIFDILSDFRTKVSDYDAVLQKQPDDIAKNRELLELLTYFLAEGLLQDDEFESYSKMAYETAERLFALDRKAINPAVYLALVNAGIDQSALESAEIWCARAAEAHPAELDTFLAALRLHFEKHDGEAFTQTMEALRASKIVVDKKTMDLIRLFINSSR